MEKRIITGVFLVFAGLTLIITGIANAQNTGGGAAMRELFQAVEQISFSDMNDGGSNVGEITGSLYDGVTGNDKRGAAPVYPGYNSASGQTGHLGMDEVKPAEGYYTGGEKILGVSKGEKPGAAAEIGVDLPKPADQTVDAADGQGKGDAEDKKIHVRSTSPVPLLIVLLLLLAVS